jgi:hypothetical protein
VAAVTWRHAVAERADLGDSDPVRRRLRFRFGRRVRRTAVGALTAGMLVVAATAGHALGGREPGAYPPDRGMSPGEVVRAYVDAINRRDGPRFCSVVAPWISGRFDLFGNDPDSNVLKPIDCPQIVSGLIGYIEDCCPPKFVRYEIVRLGPITTDGALQRVDVELRVHVEEDKKPKTLPLTDVVWLVRDDGAWRIAKLGPIAAWASLAGGESDELRARPNVAAERRDFAAEVAAFERRQRAREASYRRTVTSLRCKTTLTLPDPPRDMNDWIHPAPRTSIAHIGRADLRSLSLGRSGLSLCLRFEMAAGIRGPSQFSFNISDKHAGGNFFSQGFDVDLRSDGRARVTSGLDRDRRPIAVPAKVAVSGTSLTLLVDRRSFAVGKPYPLSNGRPSLDRFGFGAAVNVRLSTRRETTDPLGTTPNDTSFTYPTGAPCPNGC